jgi:hypothetical protein
MDCVKMLQVYILVARRSFRPEGDTIMIRGRGRLGAFCRRFGQDSAAQLPELFTGWVNLKEDFGNAKRTRLFSPHKSVLAVPVSGA